MLEELQHRLTQEIEPLNDHTRWRLATLTAGREGGTREQVWRDLIQKIEEVNALERQKISLLTDYAPVVPSGCLVCHEKEVFQHIITYLEQGKKSKDFALFMHQDWKKLIKNIQAAEQHQEVQDILANIQALTHLEVARTKEILDQIIAHLGHNGKLSGTTLLIHRDWKKLIDSTKVMGRSPSLPVHFEAIHALIDSR